MRGEGEALRQRGARKEAVTARVTGLGAGVGIRRAWRRTGTWELSARGQGRFDGTALAIREWAGALGRNVWL